MSSDNDFDIDSINDDMFGMIINPDNDDNAEEQPFITPLKSSCTSVIEDEYEEDEDDEDTDEESSYTESIKEEHATPVKRGRGRPRKISIENPSSISNKKINSNNRNYPSFAKQLHQINLDKDNCYKFTEFDKLEVVYKNITDPMGAKSNYFNVFSKKSDSDKYNTSAITLSKKYVCINMEELIEKIKSSMTVDEINLHVSPFVVEWVGRTERELKAIESQVQKDLFSVVSGFKADSIFEIRDTQIELSISNSYDGKSSFQISFNFSFTLPNGKIYKDYFTINDFSNKYLHKGIQINDIQESIDNIDENQIINTISAMKKYTLNETDIKYIRHKLNKENSKKFADFLDSCPEKYNNLYFSLLALSNILNNNYSSDQRSGLNQVIRGITMRAIALNMSKKKVSVES